MAEQKPPKGPKWLRGLDLADGDAIVKAGLAEYARGTKSRSKVLNEYVLRLFCFGPEMNSDRGLYLEARLRQALDGAPKPKRTPKPRKGPHGPLFASRRRDP